LTLAIAGFLIIFIFIGAEAGKTQKTIRDPSMIKSAPAAELGK
jgi:hypothetical protein